MSLPAEVLADNPQDTQVQDPARTAYPILIGLSFCHLLNDMIQ